MKTIKLGSSSLEVPVVAVGCMRINSLDKNEAWSKTDDREEILQFRGIEGLMVY